MELSHSLEEIFKQATLNEPVSQGGRDTRGRLLEKETLKDKHMEVSHSLEGGRDTKGQTQEVSHSLVIWEDRDHFADLDPY